MHRRHVLLFAGTLLSGCTSSQSTNSTPTSKPTQAETAQSTETAATTPEQTQTKPPTNTVTPVSAAAEIETVVDALNQVYRELSGHLAEFDAVKPDYQLLRTQLQRANKALEEATPGDDDEQKRLGSLRTTQTVFKEFVASFSWLRDAYSVHAKISIDYRASNSTTDTGELLREFESHQKEALDSATIAVTEFESLSDFDRALVPSYGSFGEHVHGAEQLSSSLKPFVEGLREMIIGRHRWTLATDQFDASDYESAKETFADIQSTFEEARQWLRDADPGMGGPLGSYHDTYSCDADAGRKAAISYQSACRSYLFDNPESGQENADEAESEYDSCDEEDD